MHLTKSVSADGTEIRNYVNGEAVSSCYEGSCTAKMAACNNIFYIKNGYVIRYTPVGTGGMKCFTDERTSPCLRPCKYLTHSALRAVTKATGMTVSLGSRKKT